MPVISKLLIGDFHKSKKRSDGCRIEHKKGTLQENVLIPSFGITKLVIVGVSTSPTLISLKVPVITYIGLLVVYLYTGVKPFRPKVLQTQFIGLLSLVIFHRFIMAEEIDYESLPPNAGLAVSGQKVIPNFSIVSW